MATTTKQTFYERLEKHPELKSRFETILDVTEASTEGPDTADAVEQKTVNEVRRLGSEVMTDWAKGKAARALETHKADSPQARSYKKKLSDGTPALER